MPYRHFFLSEVTCRLSCLTGDYFLRKSYTKIALGQVKKFLFSGRPLTVDPILFPDLNNNILHITLNTSSFVIIIIPHFKNDDSLLAC
jgi:hypothetical protein